MQTINLEPTLDGYKNILRYLERIDRPDHETQETIDNLRNYIAQQEGGEE